MRHRDGRRNEASVTPCRSQPGMLARTRVALVIVVGGWGVVPISGPEAFAQESAPACEDVRVIDFDAPGLEAGEVLSGQYAALGVQLSATNNVGGHPDIAIVFDSAAPTGGDHDLGTPNQAFDGPGVGSGGGAGMPGENADALGNIAIVAERAVDQNHDGLVDNPDDEGGGGAIHFHFDSPVEILEVEILDIDDQGSAGVVEALDNVGATVALGDMLPYGDNSVQVVTMNAADVSTLNVVFPGSGAVARVAYCERTVVPPSATPPATWTSSATPTRTETSTRTHTVVPTSTPTRTHTPTATRTNTSTPTRTLTPTVTETPVPTDTPTPAPYCGDGFLDVDEMCDDGNDLGGDGCEIDCTRSTACGPAVVHAGAERFVGSCGEPSYGNIQSAIDASADGDLVSVCPGTYEESVVVTVEVTVRSTAGPAVTTVISGDVAFDVRRSGVTIEGLSLVAEEAAVAADQICPLSYPECARPGRGSFLSVRENTISASLKGVAWSSEVSCAMIVGNTMADNEAHIEIVQSVGLPAISLQVARNMFATGGEAGASVRLENLGAGVVFARNTVEDALLSGLVLGNLQGPANVVENSFRRCGGQAILVGDGAAAARIVQNNIEDNQEGVVNEAGEGVVDARENWWGSQTGPFHAIERPFGVGDTVVEQNGGIGTSFVEFLCQPAPHGFPSVGGVCAADLPGVDTLAFGSRPDVSATGRFVSFVSRKDLNGDTTITVDNTDGGEDVFVLDRRPNRRPGSFCLGGANPGAPCRNQRDCAGDFDADPIVNDGACALIRQLTNDTTGLAEIPATRLDKRGDVFFSSSADLTGENPDASIELMRWSHRDFHREEPSDPHFVLSALSAEDAQDTEQPSPEGNGRRVAVVSTGDPAGLNDDGNREIFLLDTRKASWAQMTDTSLPVDNRRPSAHRGKVVLFDSNGDLHNDPRVRGMRNADGNRELFMARLKGAYVSIVQMTDTRAPVENRAGSVSRRGKLVTFSSNGDFIGENPDGNREIFVLSKGRFEQLSHSTTGENVHPMANPRGRFVAFESTSDLEAGGAVDLNRRIFLFDRKLEELIVVSRSLFGSNVAPRISNGRFVVWESTSDLTGRNPIGEPTIYVFDRRRDD